VRSTGAHAYVHEESHITFRPQNQHLAPVYIEEFATNSIVNSISSSQSITTPSQIQISVKAPSAAARQGSNFSAANPRSSFVAHSHTLRDPHTPARVSPSSHAYIYDARPDKQFFSVSINQFKCPKQHLAPIYIEEFAINSVVSVSDAGLTSGFGYYSDSGNAQSVSTAGVSSATNTIRTGQQETGLQPIADIDQLRNNVNAGVQITQKFGSQAANEWANVSGKKRDEAQTNADKAAKNGGSFEGKTTEEWKQEASRWEEGGIYRGAGVMSTSHNPMI
jgi:hypothetical protein